jgi:acetyltransferase-like isoleucine patch superfamily enzyme
VEKTILRRGVNRILHLIARFAPGGNKLRPYIHKLRGVRISGKVYIGDDVYLENEHPECIEIHDGAQIALRANLIAHFRGTGKIIIEKNVWIGMACNIAATPGQILRIGEGSVIGMNSTVNRDIPPHVFAAGSPAKPIFRVTVPMKVDTDFKDFKNGLKPIE